MRTPTSGTLRPTPRRTRQLLPGTGSQAAPRALVPRLAPATAGQMTSRLCGTAPPVPLAAPPARALTTGWTAACSGTLGATATRLTQLATTLAPSWGRACASRSGSAPAVSPWILRAPCAALPTSRRGCCCQRAARRRPLPARRRCLTTRRTCWLERWRRLPLGRQQPLRPPLQPLLPQVPAPVAAAAAGPGMWRGRLPA
mmetsp:Transcript_6119/g.25558  ORF Transcript_6119/g.25558 Transcript_6119/m.25558 type:complete len:200 (+) Transcript_6119:435-1034(+)